MNDDLKHQDDADESAAHAFMERSVMCAEVTLTGATARAIARYISNLEVESDNDLAGVQSLAKELMTTSEELVKQNAKLRARVALLEGLLRECLDFACPNGESPTSDLACRIAAFLKDTPA